MNWTDLIGECLADMQAAWPTDDEGRLLPCPMCENRPVEQAIVGANPVHVYHDLSEAMLDALIEREWVNGRRERLWLGKLHVGTVQTHPSGCLYVSSFLMVAEPIEREADILATLLDLWGHEERRAS